jgi:hypothetical protein
MRKLTLKPERSSGKPTFSEDDVLKDYVDGVNASTIKSKYRISPATMYKIVDSSGIPRRRSIQQSSELHLKMKALKKDGWTVKAIADKYKKSRGSTASLIYNTK